MGEIAEIKTGKGITKADSSGGIYPIISGGKEPMGYYHQKNRNANTITVSRVGAYAGYVSFIEKDFYLNDKCFSVIPQKNVEADLSVRYLYYVLKNKEVSIMEMQSEGGVPTINTEKISSVKIPIPSLALQKKIVNVLCNFDAVCNDLSIGIPAEIEARKKQYEYYREQLLTFKKAG